VWRGEKRRGWRLAFHCDDPIPPGTLPAKKTKPASGGAARKDSGADWHHMELAITPAKRSTASVRYQWRHDAPPMPRATVHLHRVITRSLHLAPATAHACSIDTANKETIRQRFDLVDYAVRRWWRHPGPKVTNPRARHGGMLINPEKQIWNCFGDDIGGDCFEMVAYAKVPHGSQEPKRQGRRDPPGGCRVRRVVILIVLQYPQVIHK